MPILGRNAFDNPARAQETGANSVTWQGDLTVTGTVTAEGGEVGAVILPNGTYLKSVDAAGTGYLDLLLGEGDNNTFLNAKAAKVIHFGIGDTVKAILSSTVFSPASDGLIALGTALLGFGTLFLTLGRTVQLTAGANGKAGTFTANGTTPVIVSTTGFVAGSTVAISLKTVGGTVGALPHLATTTPGTGFTVVGTASDTSVYNWVIIDQA